ncbi:transmembrane protein 186 [Eublepharis macularius]|uniref:Transmembrane protein 186 n=1 Tax=Eublepharis macularius TaxID=481883 RepID=A0AA97LCH9_EUBMA|nr:transmembrane protein 186 [Eublepharis macularius]
MARMLGVCSRLRSVSSWGRHLQNAASLGQWEQASSCSFRTCAVLQLHGWQNPASQVVLLRCLGISAPSQWVQEQHTTESTKDFKLIYRFPGIKYCRALSRLKLMQTALTVVVLPPVWFFYWQNQVTQAQCLYSTGIACFAGIMLYAMSYYFRRIIGMMYLNKDGTVLRVSHLTFWGKRKDFCCPVETIMTLDDIGEDRKEVLLQFKQYDGDQFLYFTLRFGQVVDKDGFAKVFGEVE